MWKFIKIVLIVIAFMISATVIFTFLFGYMFYNGLYELDKAANAAVVQQVADVDGRISIRVPLRKEYGMVIDGFKKCSPPAGMRDEPDYTASCTDGCCTIVVTFDERIPHSIGLYVEKGDACLYERFDTEEKVKVVNYFAKVEMSDALVKALALPADDYDVGSLKAHGRIAYQMNGSKKVIFNYGEKKIVSDQLTINGEVRAPIIFD